MFSYLFLPFFPCLCFQCERPRHGYRHRHIHRHRHCGYCCQPLSINSISQHLVRLKFRVLWKQLLLFSRKLCSSAGKITKRQPMMVVSFHILDIIPVPSLFISSISYYSLHNHYFFIEKY